MQNIQKQRYSGTDDIPMMINLSRQWEQDNIHITDLPYRLSSWALEDPENVCIWLAENQIVGWAVLQSPFWTIDFSIYPEIEQQLLISILEWAELRIHAVRGGRYERPGWFVNVFSQQRSRIQLLEQAGFVCQDDVGEDSWSKVLLVNPLYEQIYQPQLPQGFSIRPLAGSKEAERYVFLHRKVFGSKNMTASWRRRIIVSPDYRNDIDLIAVGQDGRLAAFCIGWLADNPSGLTGQIEPLGVHPSFQGIGLGHAILAENLRRMQLLKANKVVVETDRERKAARGLYESLGFRLKNEILVYRKDYN